MLALWRSDVTVIIILDFPLISCFEAKTTIRYFVAKEVIPEITLKGGSDESAGRRSIQGRSQIYRYIESHDSFPNPPNLLEQCAKSAKQHHPVSINDQIDKPQSLINPDHGLASSSPKTW